MVVDAAGRILKQTRCRLEDVVFAKAIALPDGQERLVQLILSEEEESKRSVRLVSMESAGPDDGLPWTVHATGRIVPFGAPPAVPSPLMPDGRQPFIANCQRQVGVTDFYQTMGEHQVELGPRLRVIDAAWVGDGEVLCRLRVPDRLDQPQAYHLHPVLLDACLQVMGGAYPYDTELTLVPTAVERFHFVERPESDRLWCHVRIRGPKRPTDWQLTTDACLCEEDGRLIAALDGIRYDAVPRRLFLQALGKDFAEWVYQPTWVPKPRGSHAAPRTTTGPGRWLVFADRHGFGDKLAELLHRGGERCVLVEPGKDFGRVAAGCYHVDPKRPDHLQQLFEATGGPGPQPYRGIVHFWSLNVRLDAESPAAALRQSEILGCATVLHLAQAMARAGWDHLPVLCLATRGAQPVEDSPEPLWMEQALLWGLGRTVAVEMPELNCLRVDLDPVSGTGQVALLMEELLAEAEEPELAFRRGTRHVPRLVRHQTGTPTPLLTPQEGTYLITGGTGALGLKLAGWLVDQGVRHLVLVSRRGASSMEARGAIEAWRQAGADVVVRAADVSKQDEAAGVLDHIRTKMPRLRGIVHAAGVLDDGVIRQLTWDRFRSVLAGKAEGAWHLHRLTSQMPLDFFVAFSSIASLLGSPGQGNYAAANAFLDALMHHRRALNLPGLSINWGPWAESGMAADMSAAGQRVIARRGFEHLEAPAALAIMSALVAQNATQAAVVEVDWRNYIDETNGGANPFLLESLAPAGARDAEVDSEFRQRLERAPADQRQSMLVEFVCRIVVELLGRNPGEPLPLDQGFYEMGFDSLTVMLFRNRLQSSLGVSLPATMAFKFATVQALTDHLAQGVRSPESPPASETREDRTWEEAGSAAELAAALDRLSDDELADRLADKLTWIKRGHG
jgi:NAD(P)-dependent dehydrogenase (short-subunit alcohol dehydrogenase family)